MSAGTGQMPARLQRSLWAAMLCALAAGAIAGRELAVTAHAQPSPLDCNLQGDEKERPLLCTERGAKTSLARGDAEIASISPEAPGMTDVAAARRADDEKSAIEVAIKFWLRAKDEGIGSGAQASLTAQRRIKMYSLTCVIADKTEKVLNSPLTDVAIQQRALKALGYYQGPLNGELSVSTRIAIRRFQNAMAWVDSGELNSRQIVYLICNGAETARDAPSSTRLALMYAAGVGVIQHHGYALGFLKQAEPRDLDAKYFLAVLSGTGWCGFPINYNRADQRLKEAAAQNHLYAQYLQTHYPPLLDQKVRWKKISTDLEFRKSIKILGTNCPDPATVLPKQTSLRPPDVVMVASKDVSAELQIKRELIKIRGRLSMELRMEWQPFDEPGQGEWRIGVRHLNLVLPDVPQAALTGKVPKSGRTGLLGVSRSTAAYYSPTHLRDAREITLNRIPIEAHFPQLDEIFPPQLAGGLEQDYFVSRTQTGRATMKLTFSEPLDQIARRVADDLIELNVNVSLGLVADPIADQRGAVFAFSASTAAVAPATAANSENYEGNWSICIQPVRIKNGANDPKPTGKGFLFGMSGAQTQWAKAGIQFVYLNDVKFQSGVEPPWMESIEPDLKVWVAGSEEESKILALAEKDKCVEIFFVENFDPEHAYGGGFTLAAGKANAKIITSDANASAENKINETHLAHELGHVLGLTHPNDPRDGLIEGSRGTLMCWSGFKLDNPKKNSLHNAETVRNALLSDPKLYAKKSPFDRTGYVCKDEIDCGKCP